MNDTMTLSWAIDYFLSYIKTRKNRSEKTIDTYRSQLGIFLQFTGDMPLEAMSTRVVDDYALHIEQFNFAPKTFYNKLTPIRSMIRFLYAKDYINIRPESIDLPAVEDTEANFLTPAEQMRVALACRNERELAIFLTLTRSGARVSELVGIKTQDLYERSIVIRKGKGRKSRITFIAADAEKAIERFHSTLSSEPEYLICNRSGGKISRQYVYKIIKQLEVRSGIKKEISPHTMRHTCGTNLLMNGASIQDVQKILGHANIQTTLIYAHFTNDHLKGGYDNASKEMLMLC